MTVTGWVEGEFGVELGLPGYEWAVRLHALENFPDSFVIVCDGEQDARRCFESWQTDRPWSRPELLRRTVTVTKGSWEQA